MLRAVSSALALSPIRGTTPPRATLQGRKQKMPTTRASSSRRAAAAYAAADSVTPVSRIVKTSVSDVPVETVHLSAKEGTEVRPGNPPRPRALCFVSSSSRGAAGKGRGWGESDSLPLPLPPHRQSCIYQLPRNKII